LLVWVYFIFLFYYLFAEFTYVSDRIDVLLIERMYNMHRRRSEKGKKIENFLFQKPRLLLEKYAKQFERGATIFEEGSSGKDVFFIFNGRVRVEKTVRRRVEVLNSLGEGEFFGEMAYLLGEKRTARVVAEEGSLILVIKSRIFEELIRTDTTVAHDVIHSLCNRLKGSIEK
jgi:membrane protein